jgi:Ala-tRNA(Pro) deacylase
VTSEPLSPGLATVTRYLDEQGISYDVVEHPDTYSAADEARASGVPPDHAAKTIALRDHDRLRLAVIPASHRLDLHKARDALGAHSSLRLASEEEIASEVADFEVGALPPLGPLLPAPEIVDRRLLEHEQILFSGGDHRHGVLIDPNDLVEVVQPTIADICVD